jgi:hypothetical protein
MAMQRLRIVILTIFIAATCVNGLYLKLQFDKTTPLPAPNPFDSAMSTDPFGNHSGPDPTVAQALRERERQEALDKALIAQVVIIASAGVAWFLVKPSAS